MTRAAILALLTAMTLFSWGTQPVVAREAPWCAVINNGEDSVYWDCQYSSFEDCYRRGNILGGNRGFCNPSPYYVANAPERTRLAKRRARPQ